MLPADVSVLICELNSKTVFSDSELSVILQTSGQDDIGSRANTSSN